MIFTHSASQWMNIEQAYRYLGLMRYRLASQRIRNKRCSTFCMLITGLQLRHRLLYTSQRLTNKRRSTIWMQIKGFAGTTSLVEHAPTPIQRSESGSHNSFYNLHSNLVPLFLCFAFRCSFIRPTLYVSLTLFLCFTTTCITVSSYLCFILSLYVSLTLFLCFATTCYRFILPLLYSIIVSFFSFWHY